MNQFFDWKWVLPIDQGKKCFGIFCQFGVRIKPSCDYTVTAGLKLMGPSYLFWPQIGKNSETFFALVNRKDPFSIKNLVHFSIYRSIRDRKFNVTDKIPELISLRTTLVQMLWSSYVISHHFLSLINLMPRFTGADAWRYQTAKEIGGSMYWGKVVTCLSWLSWLWLWLSSLWSWLSWLWLWSSWWLYIC